MKIVNLLTMVVTSTILGAQIPDTLLIDDIVIYSHGVATPLHESSRAIHILDQDLIASSPVQSFEEMLGLHAGLDVQQRGVHGIQGNLSIRGGTFEQALILVNGVRMNDIQTGHHNLNLPLHPSAVKQIEVVKGPASRRFGQNAYSGAVNIITRPTKSKNHASIHTNYGDFGTFMAGANANLSTDKSAHLINLQYNQSDGYRYNSDYKKYHLWYQNQTTTPLGELSFQGGFVDKKFGANGFYASPAFMDQYEEVQTSTINARLTMDHNKWTLVPNLYWRRNQDLYLFIRDQPEVLRNFHINHSIGSQVDVVRRDDHGSFAAGVDIRREFLRSNNLGDRDRWVQSAYVERDLLLMDERLNLTPGVTWTHFSDFGSFWYPGIDIGYQLHPSHRVFANIGKTYRVPSFTDLYYQDRANLGNPNLVPEEALAYELGYRWTSKQSTTSLNFFRRETNNLIDWLKSREEDPWRPENISDLTTEGIEVQYAHQNPSPWLPLLSIGYTYIHNKLQNQDLPFSRYALENLRHQLVVNTQFRISPRLSSSVVYRYHDRISLDDYQLVDTKVTYELPSFHFFFLINNLFDQEYRESNLVPLPGRWVHVGAEWQIPMGR